MAGLEELEEHTAWISKPFLSLFLVFSLFLLRCIIRSAKSKKTKLPPSVPKLPIIGNLHQLGGHPHRSLTDLSRKHGPLMFIQLGWYPALVVSSAEMAQQVLKTHDLNFSSRPPLVSAMKLMYGFKDVIFSPYGEYWRQVRKICVLELLSSKRVESFRSVREEEVANMIRKVSSWKASAVNYNLSEMFVSLTTDTVCRVALGRNSGGEYGSNSSFSELTKELGKLLGAFNFGDLFPSMQWLDVLTGLDRRMKKHVRGWDALLHQVIEEHQDPSRDEKEPKDFVDVLLRVQKQYTFDIPFTTHDIKALLLDMIVAAIDTTSTTIEWTMAELVKNPEVMKKAQAKVRGVAGRKSKVDEDDICKMEYLKSAIKEALRLHPPSPLLVPRESIKDAEIQGYAIPAKTRVYINAWAIGRDPASWERAEEFLPERFINSSIDFKGQDFLLIPFGGGRRGCPGISFALPIVELALANLLHQFDWKLPNKLNPEELDMTEAEAFGVTVHRKSDMILVPVPHFFDDDSSL